MKTILARSKRVFDQMMEYNGINDSNVESQDAVFISICSPKDDEERQPLISRMSKESYFKSEHSNVKIMYFGDYGETEVEGNPFAFSKEQAKELYEFILANKDKSIFICHCGAGISRSAACATFIFDNFGEMTWDEFKQKNPHIAPNQYIIKMLNEAKKEKR